MTDADPSPERRHRTSERSLSLRPESAKWVRRAASTRSACAWSAVPARPSRMRALLAATLHRSASDRAALRRGLGAQPQAPHRGGDLVRGVTRPPPAAIGLPRHRRLRAAPPPAVAIIRQSRLLDASCSGYSARLLAAAASLVTSQRVPKPPQHSLGLKARRGARPGKAPRRSLRVTRSPVRSTRCHRAVRPTRCAQAERRPLPTRPRARPT